MPRGMAIVPPGVAAGMTIGCRPDPGPALFILLGQYQVNLNMIVQFSRINTAYC